MPILNGRPAPGDFRIDLQLELRFFDQRYAEEFFTAVQVPCDTKDPFQSALQKKYDSVQKAANRIEDAIQGKFHVDGTPDFFIFYDNRLAGVFEFHPLTSTDFVEIGFWLFPEFRGNGVLSRVLPEMLSYAKENLPVPKVLASTSVENIAAQRLLERGGFLRVREIDYIDPKSGESERQVEFEFTLKD